MSCAQFNSHAPSGISSLQFPVTRRTAKQTQISRPCFYTSTSNFSASVEKTDILRDEEADGCEQPLPLIPLPTPPSRREHSVFLSSSKPIPSPPARFFSTPLASPQQPLRQAGIPREGLLGQAQRNKPSRGCSAPGTRALPCASWTRHQHQEINPGQENLRGD